MNIGNPKSVRVDELIAAVSDVAGEKVTNRYVDGPVGMQFRNLSNARIESVGWSARVPLLTGIERTYPWIEQQVQASSLNG